MIFRDRDLRRQSHLENLRNEYMASAITTVDQVKTYRLLVMPPKPSQNSRRKRTAKLLRGLFNLQRMHSQRYLPRMRNAGVRARVFGVGWSLANPPRSRNCAGG